MGKRSCAHVMNDPSVPPASSPTTSGQKTDGPLGPVAGTSTPAPATGRVVSLEESPDVSLKPSRENAIGLTLLEAVQDQRHHNAPAPLGCSDCAGSRNIPDHTLSQIGYLSKRIVGRRGRVITAVGRPATRAEGPSPKSAPGCLRLAATRFWGPCRSPTALREVSSEERRSKAGRCRRSSCSKVEDTSFGPWSGPEFWNARKISVAYVWAIRGSLCPNGPERGLYGWSRLTTRPVFGGPGLVRR